MNKPWSHLPNATHIDWVIQTLRSHLKVWNAAHYSTIQIAAWSAAQDAAYNSAPREAARGAAWDATWKASHKGGVGGEGGRTAAWYAARNAAWNAIIALIAYDDAEKYLGMTTDKLKTWAILSEEPGAILLVPMVYVKEQEHVVLS